MNYSAGRTGVRRQGGQISLWLVALLMAAFAAISMAALFSMRYERNRFAEGIAWLLKSRAADAVAGQARAASEGASAALGAAPASGAMRKCVIDGKHVVSNVDCANAASSKVLALHDTRGIEAPKAPPPPPQPEPANLREQMIDKATR
jgi:hypothetical protein